MVEEGHIDGKGKVEKGDVEEVGEGRCRVFLQHEMSEWALVNSPKTLFSSSYFFLNFNIFGLLFTL